jgi:hypothetical protein
MLAAGRCFSLPVGELSLDIKTEQVTKYLHYGYGVLMLYCFFCSFVRICAFLLLRAAQRYPLLVLFLFLYV